MKRNLIYIQVLLIPIFFSCKSIKIDSIKNYTPSLIEESLNNSFIIISEPSIIPKKLLKAINKSRKSPVKYKFGKPEGPSNAHLMIIDGLPNQRIIQAGKSITGEVIIMLYERKASVGIFRRFLIIKKINEQLYKTYDSCVFPSVKTIEALKIKNNRCH